MSLGVVALLALIYLANAQSSDSDAKTISVANGKCTEAILPVTVNATNFNIKLDPPKDQQVLTDLFLRVTSDPAAVAGEVLNGTFQNQATYKIFTQLCIPTTPDSKKTAELAVAGIGFDHTYWSLGGSGSKYNYVEAALKAGHAILSYDRLGVGKSDKPQGIQEVQTATQVEIAAELGKYLKSNPDGQTFGRVIAVGHSFGSVTLNGVAVKYGNLFDANVITGLTAHIESNLRALATFSISIAAENVPTRFGSLGSEYTVWNNVINNQMNYFSYPSYDPAILKLSEDTKEGATIGEWLTMATADSPQYTNPVIVVTGDKDYITCTANCLQIVNGVDLVEGTKVLFSASTNFSTNIPKNTGHGLNAHLNAQDTYAVIQNWIASLN